MSTFIGLLRGINVGGKNKIKMAVLTEILAAVGLKDLTTYIQSGNLVFKSRKKPPALELLIKKSISDQLGLEVPVFVRDVSFFENVFAGNPYRTREITSLCVSFFSDKPDKVLTNAIQSGDYGPDEHTIKNDVAYLYFGDLPKGVIARNPVKHGMGSDSTVKEIFRLVMHIGWKMRCRAVEVSNMQAASLRKACRQVSLLDRNQSPIRRII